MTNVFLDLRLHLGGNASGPGYVEVPRETFFDHAFAEAREGLPVNVYRNPDFTDLFATVWADGGVDYRR